MQGSFVVNFGTPAYVPPPQPQVVFNVGAPVVNNGGAFYIVSRMNGLVLDVEGGSRNQGMSRLLILKQFSVFYEIWLASANPTFSSGTRIITWNKKYGGEAVNQLWRWKGESLESVASGLVLDISGQNNTDLIVWPYHGGVNQRFRFDGSCLVNSGNGKVVDISGNNSSPGAKTCAWARNGGLNQQWYLEYA